MEKNAEFIRTKEFNIVFKGYKPEEVDKFLDVLSVEYDRLIKKNNELQESLDRLKFEGGATGKDREKDNAERRKLIEEALISAHRTADEIKDNAKKEADEIKVAAQREADEIIKIRKIEEEKAIEELEAKKSSIEESLQLIQGRYNDFKTQIKEMMDGLNSTVEEADSKFTVGIVTDPVVGFEEKIPPQQAESPDEKSKEELKKEKEAADEASKEKEKVASEKEKVEKEKEKEDTGADNTAKEAKSESDASKADKDSSEVKGKEKKDEQNSETIRERKKIDIANPDIIENFFKANDD